MYGFGDDRNPANDTVNVMEEILIEYITDVVRFCPYDGDAFMILTLPSVLQPVPRRERQDYPSKIYERHSLVPQMPRS
jgi:hypothetical protein